MLYLYTVLKVVGYFVVVIKSMKYNLTYLWVHDLLSFTTYHAVAFFSNKNFRSYKEFNITFIWTIWQKYVVNKFVLKFKMSKTIKSKLKYKIN